MSKNSGDYISWGELPFKIYLSFKLIFDYWEAKAQSNQKGEALYAQEVLKELEPYPFLREPTTDFSIVKEYADQIRLLLSPLFPEALSLNEIKSGALPFTNMTFNRSMRLNNILSAAGENYRLKIRAFDEDTMYITSCIFILNSLYQGKIDYKRPYFFDIPNELGNQITMRHYRAFFNGDFAELEPLDPDFKLTAEDIKELKSNFGNIEVWKRKIPPHSFTYRGFGLMTIFDVTVDEVLSGLKSDLLKPGTLYSEVGLKELERKMSAIFNVPELQFGYALLDSEDGVFIEMEGKNIRSLILDNQLDKVQEVGFCKESREDVLDFGKTLVISDIENRAVKNNDQYIQNLKNKGIKSYIMAPIRVNGKTIGVLELGSPNRGELSTVSTNKLIDLLPIFTVAIQRGMNDYETRLEAIIQEKWTSIHPAVSWRFFDAAENYLRSEYRGEKPEMEEIIFENVYPLFGQSDIKGSSTERIIAIQEDLVEQLSLAKKVLRKAAELHPMPIYQQLSHRIKECSKGVNKGLSAGDEVMILEFLKTEIYPVFKHLKAVDQEMKNLVQAYENKLDLELGVIYKKRKGYENSVTLINDKIAEYIDKRQEEAQMMFPHYFEKYKTDGVEYNIYIGDSMVKKKDFDPLYLQNLRLWQLETMCGVEHLMHQLTPTLDVPLEVASLILVHSSPMTIKFRMAEKRFDVDGAYNVRYEIIKKRIDKAYVKGKNERLTQPGKIAIVYSQNKEALEYKGYLKYLQSQGLIFNEIEELELEELQGASGLKALRASINYEVTPPFKKQKSVSQKPIETK